MRKLMALLILVALPGTISAATLTVESDKLTYAIGETITLTVFGDDETGTAYSMFGRLLYDASLTSFQSATQNSAGPGWVPVALSSGDGFSDAFLQISGVNAITAQNLPGVLSVVTLTADAVGIVPVSWASNLQFFDLTSAPSTSFTIVPEPETAALLGLGLLGLAVRRRERDHGNVMHSPLTRVVPLDRIDRDRDLT
jgi:hypothetical protein